MFTKNREVSGYRRTPKYQLRRANPTTYLLSGLVVRDTCGRRYLGTAAKGGKFHYYICGSYLKGGKETCAARLINKNKLESAVLAKIQKQILSPTNIRSYIQRVMKSASIVTGCLSASVIVLPHLITLSARYSTA